MDLPSFEHDEAIAVAALVGSLRSGSINRLLFENANRLSHDSMDISELQIADLPHYDDDLEEDTPATVEYIRQGVETADALLIVTPEYNYSVPGVLKNAIDWLSRPTGASVLTHKPVAMMGASSGRSGTMRVQFHLRAMLSGLNMNLVAKPDVFVSFAANHFDENGMLTDEFTIDNVTRLLTELRTLVQNERIIHKAKTISTSAG